MITKKAKLLHVLNNVYFKKTEPVSIVHFLTNRCNARCSFCFIDFDNPKTFDGELAINEIEKLTKSFGKSLLNVNLTGGEPFARKDITDIAKLYIKNSTVQSIYITTNASLPNRIENFAKTFYFLVKDPTMAASGCEKYCVYFQSNGFLTILTYNVLWPRFFFSKADF